MSVQFVEHDGKRILWMSFANLRDEPVALQAIEEAKQFVATQPRKKELLTLVDVSRMRYTNAVLAAFRELTKADEPYEKAVAVYGMHGVGLIAFRANNLITGGRLKGFEKREEALAWLLAQK
jgi:hypothetical protein